MHAATAACDAASLALADVTSANFDNVLQVLRKSPDIKMNPTDSIMIKSYDGNTYSGADMQFMVRANKGTPTLVTDPVYPLCQKK
ncbi:hypothetical protein GGF32_006248 [Allomyces javanicus]|nr:hypothetical protein GGF32_006248 [Allomyces javanicus]